MINSISKTFILILVLSCSTIAKGQVFVKQQIFTENSMAEINYRKISVKDLLFYTSTEIYIKRLVLATDIATSNTGGQVVFENGKSYAYMQFVSKGNDGSGKCDTVIDNTLNVRFRAGDNYLPFQKAKMGGDDVARYYLVTNSDSKIMYGGYEWEVILGENVYLMWKQKVKGKNKRSKEKVRGLKMDGTEKKTLKDRLKGN